MGSGRPQDKNAPETGSREERRIGISASGQDQSRTNQAGQDQYFSSTTNHYYGPHADGNSHSSSTGPGRKGGALLRRHRFKLVIVGVAVLAAGTGSLATFVAMSGGDGGAKNSAHTPADRHTSQHPADDRPQRPDPNSSHAQRRTASPKRTAKPAGTQQWEGSLTLGSIDGGEKDLDASQPAFSDTDEENDFYIGDENSLTAVNGATSSVWDQGGHPGYKECSSTVDAGGAEKQTLKKDSVVCVRTSEGRVGRLTVSGPLDESFIDPKATFDGVVWSLPPGSHPPAD